jgi:hypothetical protein
VNKNIILILAFILGISGLLFGEFNIVTFREVVDPDTLALTRQLVLQQDPEFPIGKLSTPPEKRWLVQVYKDGGDGIISPLDSLGNPTGDDKMLTDPVHMRGTQWLYFPISYAWLAFSLKFYPQGENGQAWQGDKIYMRIFNNVSLNNSTKYLVFKSLYTIPTFNDNVSIIPDYSWDKQGWIPIKKPAKSFKK